MKILIVDDNKQNLYMLEALLRGYGYEVESAADGVEALEKVSRDGFDMIISDILMPRMDGFQLCREIKTNERLKHIAFVFYTATYTDSKDEELALSLGAGKFIIKPQEPSVFIGMLGEVIRSYESGKLVAPRPPVEEEDVFLKQYNERLIKKLEDKMLQLERVNKKLRENLAQLSKKNRYETIIGTVTRSIHQSINLKDVLENAVEAMSKDIDGVENVSIYLVEEGKDFGELSQAEAVLKAYRGYPKWWIKRLRRIPYPKGFTWKTIIEGKPMYCADVDKDTVIGSAKREMGTKSYLSMPICFRGKTIGTININSFQKNAFNEEELKLMEIVAQQIEIAINNAGQAQALRESEERYRTFVEHTYDLIIETNIEGRYLYVSPNHKDVLGYEPSELLGRSIFEYVHPDDRSTVMAEFARASKTFSSGHIVFRFRHKNGEWRWLESTGRPFQTATGEVRGVIASRDITEHKQAEEKIGEQAELLDKAQDAIGVRDLEHRIIYWNRSAERLYGWKAEEAISKNANKLLYKKEDSPELIEAQKSVMEKGGWIGELRQVTKDGREVIVESRWTLVRGSDGKPKSILIVNTDITEKKKLEAQFLRAQRMESIGTLAGGIAHDLNNVLSPIMMALQLLRQKFTDEQSQRWLNILETSARRGADLVKQVLSFARGLEGERITIQVKHLISEIEKILKETFPKSIEIYTDIPKDLWLISGDPTQLHQVLMNLCVNARDAMPNGGILSISAENLFIDENYAKMSIDARVGPYIIITVSDTGMGISSEILDRIFEPFFTTKEPGKGTGLGLSTAFGIVKDHGGFIHVYSKVGKETAFRVYLPAVETTEVRKAKEERVELPGQGELILVVDDEASIREITGAILEIYGYRVITASDGVEGIELYAKEREEIKVVILDMMMPTMGGPAIIRGLREIDPGIRIIGASGLTEKLDEVTAEVQAFLLKPYTAETLLKTLHEVLSTK